MIGGACPSVSRAGEQSLTAVPCLVLGHGDDLPPNQLNSLASFGLVRATGADGVELDVRRTFDDALVLVHDHLLPDGRPVNRTVAVDLPDEIVRLETALDACTGMLVNIEIKNFPADPAYDPTHRVAELVAELLAARGGQDRVLASCFGVDCLDHLRASSEVATALLLLSRKPPEVLLDVAVGHDHRVVNPYASMVDERFMTQARGRSLAVYAWTGADNSTAELARLVDLGVDGLITARPHVARRVVDAARR